MVSAMLVMPFLDVVAKFLGQQNVPIIQIVWARLFFGMAMTAPLVVHSEGVKALIPHHPFMHFLRASITPLLPLTAVRFLKERLILNYSAMRKVHLPEQ